MPDKATNVPAPNGRGFLAVILILVILVPVGYSLYARVATSAGDPPQAPDRQVVEDVWEKAGEQRGYRCVANIEYMRFHHWELLRGLREKVVRYGDRGDISFDGCWNCHQSRAEFCDRCHNAAFVRPDCFGCHYYPELGKRPPLVAETNDVIETNHE
jgi:hypothetical protein